MKALRGVSCMCQRRVQQIWGANVGQIILLLAADARRRLPQAVGGVLVAVEADPLALELLHRHLRNNGGSALEVQVLAGAVVGSPSGPATLCSDGGTAVSFAPKLLTRAVPWSRPGRPGP
ncbi:unnamed protein product [Polarella glacialis]|uniref:Uncharacterized protein n=1 Tax=Polarella glacialis TaxID=89957 RepID=A0A813FRI9_POLGL|nr:unnamed protein product [Polarella glacialis]